MLSQFLNGNSILVINNSGPDTETEKSLDQGSATLVKRKPYFLFQERLENQAMNQPCLLVYTSGTTGNPKGVMVSQAWPFFT
jgi:long-subunit acyl-CoA synthetase (AMP-forming)